MEKTQLGTVVQLNTGWRDLGSWNEVWESLIKMKMVMLLVEKLF